MYYLILGDGPRISQQTQIKLWAGRFLLEVGQSLRPCLFWLLAARRAPPLARRLPVLRRCPPSSPRRHCGLGLAHLPRGTAHLQALRPHSSHRCPCSTNALRSQVEVRTWAGFCGVESAVNPAAQTGRRAAGLSCKQFYPPLEWSLPGESGVSPGRAHLG